MGALSQPLDFRKSTNNGATWSSPIRITQPGQEIRRAIIIASGNTVRRRVSPIFRSIRSQDQIVTLEWTGQGTLQWSAGLTGPWTSLADATNGQTFSADSPQRFFCLKAQ